VTAHSEPTISREREWWLRSLLVLISPRPVFAALRDDSKQAADARQEPVLAILILAGISGVLSTAVARRLLNDPEFDAVLIPVWAFIAGLIYGAACYWIAGAALYVGSRVADSAGTYRRSRHLLAYASIPLVVALFVVWPVRIAVYRSDLFRAGGSDTGTGDLVFTALEAVFLAWAVALLAIGVRTVHGWGWLRSLAAISIAVAILAVGGVAWSLV
jgi:hypothetical protein